MSSGIHIGVDPDTQCTGIAAVQFDMNGKPRLYGAWVVKSERALMAGIYAQACLSGRLDLGVYPAHVAIESQDLVYTAKQRISPQSMIPLIQVTGAYLSSMMARWSTAEFKLVKPREWKGQQPKKINQARTFNKLGIEYKMMGGKDPYCVPTKFPLLDGMEPWINVKNDGDWKHVSDAVGIALWSLLNHK